MLAGSSLSMGLGAMAITIDVSLEGNEDVNFDDSATY